ncbi:inositol monophosphatase family protein [Lottiidibacillus patelloidae]|nr:inositol monophosphatase [Lottiidibacillus patelloidae]
MTLDIDELGKFAADIVKEAGALLKELRTEPIKLEEKGDHANLVTFVDQEVEKFLVDNILEKYPDHGVVGEEGVFENVLTNFETEWVIDPIDGTTNFIHNFPFYGISVGIVHKGEGLIGVVYNPVTDELFYGQKGNGAYVNGDRLTISPEIQLSEALVATSMFWENIWTKDALHHSIIQLYKETRGVRMVGGAAITLCEIAKGTLNAYIVPMLSTWDYAGGVIILKEAGGSISQLSGSPVSFELGGSILAAHPSIHQELLNMYVDWID